MYLASFRYRHRDRIGVRRVVDDPGDWRLPKA
jgi:hypothetical protein